ncbi:C39 family peptidase [Microcoleus sp. LEGE 07076]|uniref:C39 family peptidase n=1 Tax=Microcoleus sp. LEGE 07076 TaxID=915322 RepID=UPI001882C0AD|nr:C39 family peptidase [Microcoleus sp. LEGE 07076]MBE9184889.1 C39 family peptidase [Microcoleus sp. LEGE 07076]
MAANTISKTQTIYVRQPDGLLCQSACIAMVLRTTDVHGIRAALLSKGAPGDPAVMGDYLESRVKSYKFLLNGSLNDAKKALDDGCAVITHGWFTPIGHVIVLIGYEADPLTLSYRFIVHDPRGEYDFPNGVHDLSKSGDSVRYSSYGIYATCVASDGYDHARNLYTNKTLKSNEQNAWLHIIQN